MDRETLVRPTREGSGDQGVYGSTINALTYFVIVAAAVYFFVVVPMQKLAEMRKRGEGPDTPAPSDEAVLLTEIRDLLSAQQRP